MISVKSPAKLNLILKITGKRPDGFHSIETIMQEISLSDTLKINTNQEGKLILNLEGLKIPGSLEENLITKATHLFFQKISKSVEDTGVTFDLNKKIPCGSGMGGGSSNAIATLIGLNHLFGLPLTKIQLSELAMQLGSDTVFFLFGGRCHCSGRGEIVTQLENKETSKVFLYIPPIQISTAQVFNNFIVTEPDPKNTNYQLNDLESATFLVSPELLETKKKLKQITGIDWQMTGSGSTFFTLIHPQDNSKAISKNIKSNLPGQLISSTFQYNGCHVSNN